MLRLKLTLTISALALMSCEQGAPVNSSDCSATALKMQEFVSQPVVSALYFIKENPAEFKGREIVIQGAKEAPSEHKQGALIIDADVPHVNKRADIDNAKVTKIRCYGYPEPK